MSIFYKTLLLNDMSVEITDSVNYYKWQPGSTGNLVLGYQLGGNDNLSTILDIQKTGTLSSAGLRKTTDSTDTDTPVIVMVDKNGALIRGYSALNSINTNFVSLQTDINSLKSLSIGTRLGVAEGNLSILYSTLNSQNLNTRLTTAESQLANVDILKSQNLNTRLTTAESQLADVNILKSQNLNTRLNTTESQLTDVNILKSQNLNSRLGAIESQNLDSRIAHLTAILGSISAADSNFINQYNQLNAAIQSMQVEISNIKVIGGGSGLTSNSNLFNMIVVQAIILFCLMLYLILRK